MNRKSAIVTGGTRGIGLAIAAALARDGYALTLCGRREAHDVADTLQTLRDTGADARYCRADVALKNDRDALLACHRAGFGTLNVLVNNAGVAPEQRADLLEASEASFERVLRINLQGPYFLTQSAARWMAEQKTADPSFKGCIVNIGSISAVTASISRGEYCVAKAGVAMMTRLFASRLGEYGIPVFEVRPGIIRTDMTETVKDKYDNQIAETDLLVQRRWGLPEDVGRAVAMLASGQLDYSTGQVINVDGGLSIPRL